MPSKSSAVLNPNLEMAKQTTVYTNLKQDIVCTTKDKLQLALQDYQEALKAKQKIGTYGGVFLSLLLSVVTSTPQDFLKVSADIWSAIFLLGLFISGCITLVSIAKYYKIREDSNIDFMCQKIMNGIEPQE